MIIGLTGRMGSGKDSSAAYLIKNYAFERRAFADPLKRSVAQLFDIPLSYVDEMKSDIDTGQGFVSGGVVQVAKAGEPVRQMTWRELLQRYGTEAHRDIFGEDFWVDVTLPADGFYGSRNIAITDVRFHSEADRIHLLGGRVVRVVRGSQETPHHRSESEQDSIRADYQLNNDGTLEALAVAVENMMQLFWGEI